MDGLIKAVQSGNYPTLQFDIFSGKTAWGDLRVKIVRIANDKPYSAWGNADPIVKTPPKLIVGSEAWNIKVFNYNAYKTPQEMGITWYEVNSTWLQFQETIRHSMGYSFSSATTPPSNSNSNSGTDRKIGRMDGGDLNGPASHTHRPEQVLWMQCMHAGVQGVALQRLLRADD
ncbi:hypothetical protein [Vulcanisaeta sp. JCM 16161]|uniref:hypothetical protein n=1 Tax=Vulcanisaeta sp. JCM 16161 TaxID=1295372 RepID=UPI001FB29A86|nr:hypothetical protein [Vulcanisaeta sp. JCM 16161]